MLSKHRISFHNIYHSNNKALSLSEFGIPYQTICFNCAIASSILLQCCIHLDVDLFLTYVQLSESFCIRSAFYSTRKTTIGHWAYKTVCALWRLPARPLTIVSIANCAQLCSPYRGLRRYFYMYNHIVYIDIYIQVYIYMCVYTNIVDNFFFWYAASLQFTQNDIY